jgi:hypothetical protein
MEAIYYSEKLVDFQQTAWRYIPEDRNISYKYGYVIYLYLTDLTYLEPALMIIIIVRLSRNSCWRREACVFVGT